MKIAFYGSSLVSSYWNGAATYYRGILKALHARGYDITFYEPDAFDRQQHRDIDPPEYAKVVVYPATQEAMHNVLSEAAAADIVVLPGSRSTIDDLAWLRSTGIAEVVAERAAQVVESAQDAFARAHPLRQPGAPA